MSSFKIVSFNAEGISPTKTEILPSLGADILCLQETHKDSTPPKIPGMHLVVYHASPVHGSAIYARDISIIMNSRDRSDEEIEILEVEMTHITIVSVYKPPLTPFRWPKTVNPRNKALIAIGDFNSHNTIWGYTQNNKDGETVEEWALNNNMAIVHNAKDKPSFMSARWRRGYNPDLAFVSSRLHTNFEKTVNDPIPKSQHRPITLDVKPAIGSLDSKPIPRFNFRKAKWEDFTPELDSRISTIKAQAENYEDFQKLVWEISRKHIPRGCRKTFIPCLTDQSKELYEDYVQAYNTDPFDENTIVLGETLAASVANGKQERWQEMICNTDMTHNSKKAWTTIKKLNTEKNARTRVAAVRPDEVANQLLLNGKPLNKERGYYKRMKSEMEHIMRESDEQFHPFTMEELQEAMKHLKPGKAAGLDGITTEIIQHFGIRTRSWILALLNNCATSLNIPKIWRRARVVALLKPGKDPESKKSYRPISLLCILYKLYERMIMARMSPTVEQQLSPDQAGFRPGRSCCSQILNLTQYIEDGFEARQITGAVFVDLTAAYDTVNHRMLLLKLAKVVHNTKIVKIIQSLLTNRRFFVEMAGKKSRYRTQKNGLPQGSVLAPILFNIYTNDQPEFDDMRRFIYADDLCIATQSRRFEIIERRLSAALEHLTGYYKQNSLNANPGKTQVCAFHLNNHQAKRKLNIIWNNERLEHVDFPVYLGVTLDRTLSFAEHVKKLKSKVATRNNLLGKLANSNWGTDPKTLRTTALALCYSTAEYCSAVWARSCHAQKIDPELNKSCRIITGTMKATPLPELYRLAGIVPPHIRRDTHAKTQKYNQENDTRHPLFGHSDSVRRLKSRKSFMTIHSLDPEQSANHRLEKWREWDHYPPNGAIQSPNEQLPSGTTLPRKDWVTLNRARTRVGKTGNNTYNWGLSSTSECLCGHPVQTMEHILRDCGLGPICTDQDLLNTNEAAKQWIQYWRDKI